MRQPKKALTRRQKLRAWIQTHKKALGISGGIALALILGVQLAYPHDRALPFARLNGDNVVWTSRNDLAARLQKDFQAATLTLKADGSTVKMPLIATGANLNTDRMVGELADYPLWQRLLPLSIVVRQPEVTHLDVYFDQPRLQIVAENASEKLSAKPTDARLAIENGELVATEAKPGHQITPTDLMQTLSQASFNFGASTIRLDATEIPPARSDAAIAPVRHQAEAAIARDITISGPDDATFHPDSHAIASWLVIETLKDNTVRLAIDEKRVAAYVDTLNNKVKIDPGVTKITLVDGEETGRNPGSMGREIVTGQLIDQLKDAVMKPTAPTNLTIEMEPVPSVVVNDRRYTSTQKGLRAYVQHVTTTQDIHIALIQLDGNRWTAFGRANDTIPSASTYKLFVALVLFDRMSKGQIHWDDPMLDTTVAGCLERMIVPSTNPCAEKWIAQFGRNTINQFAWSHGFSHGTTFNGYIATHTTAADLAKYMVGLYNGTLMPDYYHDILLEKMGRQLYRYGIPTGTAGWAQDKVGFLWDYIHDTAIVHHPKGTYAVAIMTRGQSYARIAQITRELERIMYP